MGYIVLIDILGYIALRINVYAGLALFVIGLIIAIYQKEAKGIIITLILIAYTGLGIYNYYQKRQDEFSKELEQSRLMVSKFYVLDVEEKIELEKKNNANYQVPTKITDINFANDSASKPKKMELNLDENGTVISGTMVYTIEGRKETTIYTITIDNRYYSIETKKEKNK